MRFSEVKRLVYPNGEFLHKKDLEFYLLEKSMDKSDEVRKFVKEILDKFEGRMADES